MNNIEDMVAVVHRLENAVKTAGTQKQFDQLKKSLTLARSRLMKARAKRINEEPKGDNIPEYKNVRRSSFTEEERIKLFRTYGKKAYLSMPK